MAPKKVKEETEDRIVLVDSMVQNILDAVYHIVFGLFALFFCICCIADACGHDIIMLFFGLLLAICGVLIILMGLYHLTIIKSIIIDKRLQNIIIKKYLFGKYIVSTKTIPFSDIKRIEITYYTSSGKYDHDSPADHIYHSYSDLWVLFLITVHEDSIGIYDGNRKSKSKVEQIAKKICEITGKKATYKTSYYLPDIGG
ncbi:MAG: hypothetical protein C5S48_02235 [Candidatus Methanogaster sp.]|nr:MAG: hypothetical protein C5S48_02235 [ANME-2 cluster archaeon]